MQEEFTAREREIYALAAVGRTNREIAAALFIEESTVKTHMTRVLAKSGVRTRSALIAAAGSQSIGERGAVTPAPQVTPAAPLTGRAFEYKGWSSGFSAARLALTIGLILVAGLGLTGAAASVQQGGNGMGIVAFAGGPFVSLELPLLALCAVAVLGAVASFVYAAIDRTRRIRA